ncbi:YdeI/OmpD-associated family protein [Pseudolysinimonas sp.]|uniref:YdeI/OmpD-associated family protein n=1 Tax=Pseudolysinimonas sp. TaxID=2680009 RepID=UPI003F7F0226
MVAYADKPLLHFTDPAEWDRFLRADPPDGGVRLLLLKKAATVPGIRYAEALDVALCHGWIDGQTGRHDDDFMAQAFTPRRARSPWSQINVAHAERLIGEGRMRPGGFAEIERAKADGRWDAAYRQKGAVAPDDLRAALDAEPAAAAAWATLDAQNRFAILFRIGAVTRAETRARKIAEFIAMLARGERIYP